MNDIIPLLYSHLDSHPKAEITDAVKFLYQACFGGGHMIPDPQASYAYLCREASSLSKTRQGAEIEDLGNYVRLDLSVLDKLSAQTLNLIFVASAKNAPQDKAEFIDLLQIFYESDYFDKEKKAAYLRRYRASGYPAVHHSDAYRAEYSPAYRVVGKQYAHYLEAFVRIDELLRTNKPISVAIDGLCGSGKTTLAALLGAVYDCNVFHADDFFLPTDMRTPERYATPGGNIHWERMKTEVLDPLKTGKPFVYRTFDCSIMDYSELVRVNPRPLSIMEGSYSMHPQLLASYDLRIFLKTDPETQSRRILERDGEHAHRSFVEKWIPFENKYFETFPIEKQCDLVFTN